MIKYLLVLLFITGCTRNSMALHTKMVIDSNFSQTEQQLIVTSIDQWEKDTDNLIQVDLSIVDEPQEYGNDTGKIIQSDEIIAGDSVEGLILGNTTDWFSETTIFIYTKAIADPRKVHSFQNVMLHEFGHAVGLEHVEQGLMNPITTQKSCIDSLTLHNFCVIHDCSDKNIASDCP